MERGEPIPVISDRKKDGREGDIQKDFGQGEGFPLQKRLQIDSDHLPKRRGGKKRATARPSSTVNSARTVKRESILSA